MCAENIRQVYFFVITSFEYKIFSDKISIYLNTEEKGIFRFYLNDLLGNLIKKVDFNATLDKYKNDNVQEIDITNIANGTYFLRMKTPNGKFTNNNVVLLKWKIVTKLNFWLSFVTTSLPFPKSSLLHTYKLWNHSIYW